LTAASLTNNRSPISRTVAGSLNARPVFATLGRHSSITTSRSRRVNSGVRRPFPPIWVIIYFIDDGLHTGWLEPPRGEQLIAEFSPGTFREGPAQDNLVAQQEALALAHFDSAIADLTLRRAAGTFPPR
jgi:hypothetical protein